MDELLVLRVQGGDEDALELLVERWQARLHRHARQLTDHADAAADVLQKAWIAIVRGIRRLREPAQFRGWAFRIVTHKAADHVRRQQRRRAHEPAPRPAGEDRDEIDALRVALDELPADRRAILSLHYLEGMKAPEIAAIMGIPEGTVKSRLHHARAALREQLEQQARS